MPGIQAVSEERAEAPRMAKPGQDIMVELLLGAEHKAAPKGLPSEPIIAPTVVGGNEPVDAAAAGLFEGGYFCS